MCGRKRGVGWQGNPGGGGVVLEIWRRCSLGGVCERWVCFLESKTLLAERNAMLIQIL